MARIEFAPGTGPNSRYPWDLLSEAGDYFDIPPVHEKQARGVRNAAHYQSGKRAVIYITRTLYDGTVRVMLVEKWPAAQTGRWPRKVSAHG